MTDFISYLTDFLTSALIQAGRATVERNFRETLEWDADSFRDDDELDKIENEIEEAAKEHTTRIIEALRLKGLMSEDDVIEKKAAFEDTIRGFLDDFEREVKEGQI